MIQVEKGLIYDVILREVEHVQHGQVEAVRRLGVGREIAHAALTGINVEEKHQLATVERDEECEDEDEDDQVRYQLANKHNRSSQTWHVLLVEKTAPDDEQGQ